MSHKIHKADRLEVTVKYISNRAAAYKNAGYPKAKWMEFCEVLLKDEYSLILHEAKQTNSKYITVCKDGKTFKVRFSNHKPILERELRGDCDYFVGVTNLRTTNTAMALEAVKKYFEGIE